MAQIRDMIDQSNEQQAREQLQFLLDSAKGKVEAMRQKIVNLYVNPLGEGKIQILPSVEVAYYEEYRADMTSGVDSEIDGVIDSFFQMNGEGVKNGFRDLIKKGLKTILGDTSVGESYQEWYAVAPEGLSIIRTDVFCWRYNFSSTGIISNASNAFAFVFSKALVDIEKITRSELIYFVGQLAGNDTTKIKAYLDSLEEIYNLNSNKAQNDIVEHFHANQLKTKEKHRRLAHIKQKRAQ